ncbi:unnamed protein product [Porites evermanni]|uniref:Uncharacterized protein n=1 Tax=Porites evermanni TaxID=104178 RepID=A0ABN8MGU8_9CNID|nr:unnamed protein product [Porites evermanni]
MISLAHACFLHFRLTEDSLKARSSLETKCNASQRKGMSEGHEEPSIKNDNNQRTNSYDDKQLVSETTLSSDCIMKDDATSGNPTKISTNTDSQSQNNGKRNMSEFS